MSKPVNVLLLSGSPRSHTSEALLALVERGVAEAGGRAQRFLLSEKHLAPCTGCAFCEQTGNCILAAPGTESNVDDDYAELLELLGSVDALALISPLYFAGPPAQLKALLDRLQPFWARRYVLGQRPLPKRPAQLFIVGGGGDSHGFDPLVTIARSSLAVAGFTVEKVLSFVGFRFPGDVLPLPSETEEEALAFGELAHLRKAHALQREFEQRAVAAGSAFTRFVSKSLERVALQAELSTIEAELAELTLSPAVASVKTAPVEAAAAAATAGAVAATAGAAVKTASTNLPSQLPDEAHRPPVIDYLDKSFEALKQTARAKQSKQAD